MPAMLAPDPCETVNKITTVEELVDYPGNYRTKEAELMLVLVGICQKEVVKVPINAQPERRYGWLPCPIEPGCPVCETSHPHLPPVSRHTFIND